MWFSNELRAENEYLKRTRNKDRVLFLILGAVSTLLVALVLKKCDKSGLCPIKEKGAELFGNFKSSTEETKAKLFDNIKKLTAKLNKNKIVINLDENDDVEINESEIFED